MWKNRYYNHKDIHHRHFHQLPNNKQLNQPYEYILQLDDRARASLESEQHEIVIHDEPHAATSFSDQSVAASKSSFTYAHGLRYAEFLV